MKESVSMFAQKDISESKKVVFYARTTFLTAWGALTGTNATPAPKASSQCLTPPPQQPVKTAKKAAFPAQTGIAV